MKIPLKWTGAFVLCSTVLAMLVAAVRFNREAHQRELNRALIAAICKGRTQQAIALLEQGADAKSRDIPDPPVTIRSLLRAFRGRLSGARPGKNTGYHTPALLLIYPQDTEFHYVTDKALADQSDLVQALLSHGADPNARTKWGDSLLFIATGLNLANTVRLLLEHHADPNDRSPEYMTPLMWHLRKGTESARLL